jgi:hypothetical protein
MAAFVLFDCFRVDLGLGKHNLETNEIKVYLTNATPSAANTVYNTPADLATSGGYTAGGIDAQCSWSGSGATATLTGADVTFTATSGFGPFRYAVIYNNTSATKPLIGYWDYGSSISLGASESIVVDFGASLAVLS